MPPPSVVGPAEYDPKYVDVSPTYRQWMQKQLYGVNKDNRVLRA